MNTEKSISELTDLELKNKLDNASYQMAVVENRACWRGWKREYDLLIIEYKKRRA